VIESSRSGSARRHPVHVRPSTSGAEMSATYRHRTALDARNAQYVARVMDRDDNTRSLNSPRIRPGQFVQRVNIPSDLRKYRAADESGCTPGSERHGRRHHQCPAPYPRRLRFPCLAAPAQGSNLRPSADRLSVQSPDRRPRARARHGPRPVSVAAPGAAAPPQRHPCTDRPAARRA
jgi:hypothetical protein